MARYNHTNTPPRPSAVAYSRWASPDFIPLSEGDGKEIVDEATLPNLVSSPKGVVTPRSTSPKKFFHQWKLGPKKEWDVGSSKNRPSTPRNQDQPYESPQKHLRQHGQLRENDHQENDHHPTQSDPPLEHMTPPYRRQVMQQARINTKSMPDATRNQVSSVFPDPTISNNKKANYKRVDPGARQKHFRKMTQPKYIMPAPQQTVAQILTNDVLPVPDNAWVVVNDVSPMSPLEAMVQGINEVLDNVLAEHGGITNLEALWDPRMQDGQMRLPQLEFESIFPQHVRMVPPFAEPTTEHRNNQDEKEDVSLSQVISPQDDLFRWVHEARMLLSPYGRPLGWKVKLANRSIVYALLARAKDNPVKCTWKAVKLTAWTEQVQQQLNDHFLPQEAYVQFLFSKPARPSPDDDDDDVVNKPFGNNHLYYDQLDVQNLDWLDDSVVRVENCDSKVHEQDLLHLFGSYELKAPSIARWIGETNDAIKAPPTFFVRFEDSDWARAATREKQGTVIGSKALRLAQFPKQWIPVKRAEMRSFETPYDLDHERGDFVMERA